MKRVFIFRVFIAIFTISSIVSGQDYPIQPVPFTAVRVHDNFWAPRIRLNHKVTIPIAIKHCYTTGRVDNFLIAGGLKQGKYQTDYPFDDTDIYKIIEGASYSMQTFPDQLLDARIDTLITYIKAAQEPDGYLYTSRTIDPKHPHRWASINRWEKDPDGSHELYNCGHLYEAAVAHYQATGKRTLLDIAIKNADLLCRDFGPDKLRVYPGHQIVEMGLVKLYRATGRMDYLKLAKFFLDIRDGGGEYNQSHKKVTEQTEAVGHAVRATYMYSGMADVAALTGDASYIQAIDAIWEDIVYRKIYITGGIGAAAGHEGFGPAYELPNMSAYNETCASIGNIYWNWRLFLLHGESKYYDILERILYNSMMSGVSLTGDHFFYPNPLESMGQHERSEWFGCACCPSNVCRFIPSVPGYMYAIRNDRLYVNLFIQSTSKIDLNGSALNLIQETDYPWEGQVLLKVNPEKSDVFEIALRIPGWAQNVIPGDLYRFTDEETNPFQIRINGKPFPYRLENGYAILARKWKKHDCVKLSLPMPLRQIIAQDSVAADRGKTAVQRGPIVFCAEWPEFEDARVLNVLLDKHAPLDTDFNPDLLGGVQRVRGNAEKLNRKDGIIIKSETQLRMIPYYAWANRGPGEMAVWIADTASAVWLPEPTIASQSRIEASFPKNTLFALNDQHEPLNSIDHNVIHYDWWPLTDTLQWVSYVFEKPEQVSSVKIYWWDDGPWGGCRVPASWKLYYRTDSDIWQEVSAKNEYGIAKDQFNIIAFDPVHTRALKLEVHLSEMHSGGIMEWVVE